jgi:hypothetical protein
VILLFFSLLVSPIFAVPSPAERIYLIVLFLNVLLTFVFVFFSFSLLNHVVVLCRYLLISTVVHIHEKSSGLQDIFKTIIVTTSFNSFIN